MCDPTDQYQYPNDKTLVRCSILLRSVCLVVHEEKVEVAGVVDEEGLVAGRHHVAGLLVAAVADLCAFKNQFILPLETPSTLIHSSSSLGYGFVSISALALALQINAPSASQPGP